MRKYFKCLWRVVTRQPDPYGIEELLRIREQSDFWSRKFLEADEKANLCLMDMDIEGFDRYYHQSRIAYNRFQKEVTEKLDALK